MPRTRASYYGCPGLSSMSWASLAWLIFLVISVSPSRDMLEYRCKICQIISTSFSYHYAQPTRLMVHNPREVVKCTKTKSCSTLLWSCNYQIGVSLVQRCLPRNIHNYKSAYYFMGCEPTARRCLLCDPLTYAVHSFTKKMYRPKQMFNNWANVKRKQTCLLREMLG